MARFEIGSSLRGIAAPALVLITCLTVCSAQNDPSAGSPALSTHYGGQYDSVDPATGNILVTIPVRTKIGKTPFAFTLVGNSHAFVWIYSANHLKYWGISSGNSIALLLKGVVSAGVLGAHLVESDKTITCHGDTQDDESYAFSIIDAFGTSHPLPTTYKMDVDGCDTTPASAVTTDGSGYTLITSSFTILDRYGNKVGIGGSNTMTDPDGVQESYSTTTVSGISNSTYTDTLNTTALTSSVSLGYSGGSDTYQYVGGSGSNSTTTVSYTHYHLKTVFGCSGINDVDSNTSSENFPTTISTPQGNFTISYETTPGYSPDVTGRISKITYPTGGYVTYTYSGGTNGVNCSSLVVPTLVRTENDGSGNTSTWTFVNNNTSGSPTNYIVTATDPAGNVTDYNFGGEIVTQKNVYQGNRTSLVLKQVTCYNNNFVSCATAIPPTGVPITQTDVYTYLTGSSSPSLIETKTDSYGNPIEVKTYPFGASVPPAGNPLSDRAIVYGTWNGSTCASMSSVNSTVGSYMYSYPCTDITNDYSTGSANQVSQTRYAYNAGGHPVETDQLVGGSTYLKSYAGYQTNGALNSTTDVNGAVTTFTDTSCNNLLTTSTTLPVSGLSTSQVWDCNGGVVTQAADLNSQTTYYSYQDPLWRITSATDPSSNVTHHSYTTNTQEDYLNFGSSTVDSLTTFDGLGRISLVQKRQGPGSPNFDSVQHKYGWTASVGAFSTVSVPYQGTSGQVAPGGTAVTVAQFDAAGRSYSVTDGGGGTASYSYSQNDVLQTIGPAPAGENTKRRQLEYDGLGRLTSVCEITSGTMAYPGSSCGQNTVATGYLTSYSYVFDTVSGTKKMSVSQSGQSRTYKYDLLSRLVSESNPESGTTTYVYDSDGTGNCTWPNTSYYGSIFTGTYNGDLVRKTDAVGNQTCYQYDSLHRLTGQITPYGSYYCARGAGVPCYTLDKYFVYDSATVNGTIMTNAKGQSAEAYTCVGACSAKVTDEGFSYDIVGHSTDVYQSTPTSGGYYHSTATFYPNGIPATLTAPAGSPTITYNVDGEGRLSTVTSSSGQNPVSATSYNVASQVTGVTFGSGDGDTYQYDPNTGRMKQYQFKMGTLTDTDVLTWNANGSLGNLAITDQINSANTQTCGYQHDDLQRISNVNCGSAWSQAFTYDPFGNVTKSGSINWMPGYNTSNRYALAGTSYDSNGDLLNDSVHSYVWDADGRATTIDGALNLTYDALGRMVQYSNSSVHVSMLMGPLGNKPLATMSGMSVGERFVPLPGGSAMLSAYGYRHGDWLGSSRLTTSFTQTLVSDLAYAPFGETYAAAGSLPDPAFTQGTTESVGQFLSTSLYDFTFRKYAHAQGRWISPDPAGMAAVDTTNPQSWNRYAYVLNNPLVNVDPDGLACFSTGTADCTMQQFTFDCDATGVFCNLGPIKLPGGLGLLDGENSINYSLGPSPLDVLSQILSGDYSAFGLPTLGDLMENSWILDATNTNPQTGVPVNPCASAGRAPSPSWYVSQVQEAGNLAWGAGMLNSGGLAFNKFNQFVEFLNFRRGGYLDAQPLQGSRSYANYVFGASVAAAGWTLPQALSSANAYAHYSGAHYMPEDGEMDATYPYILAANVTNITNGYNAQLSGTLCHK